MVGYEEGEISWLGVKFFHSEIPSRQTNLMLLVYIFVFLEEEKGILRDSYLDRQWSVTPAALWDGENWEDLVCFRHTLI